MLAAADVNAWLAPLAGVKSADQITHNNTYINDPDMRFAVAANSIYEFRVFIRFSSPTGADFQSSFTVPAGAGARLCRVGISSGGAVVVSNPFTDASNITSQGSGAGTEQCTNLFGTLFTASTAGNLIFQWAQVTTNAGNTTLMQYSYLTGRRIG